MIDKSSNIIQMIDTYTNQIERYENLSTWFAGFSVLCILVTIIAASFIILKREKECSNKKNIYNSILSGIFLIIPSITTLYLYTFTMNMRKVALYRGYLAFLEKQWNSLADLILCSLIKILL